MYQDMLWDAFEKYWAFPLIYDASASYNITLNELWAPHSVEEEANGGRILFIYENVSLHDSIRENINSSFQKKIDQTLFNRYTHISNFIETKQGYGKDHHKFWPPLDLRYAGTDDTNELKSFMDNALQSVTNARPMKLYCQLTTTAEDIILKR